MAKNEQPITGRGRGEKKKNQQHQPITAECVCVRNLVVRTAQCYWKRLHSSDHGLHGCDDILEHQLRESFSVFLGVTGTMNDTHLFNKGTLPTLTCTCRWKDTHKIDALLYWFVGTAVILIICNLLILNILQSNTIILTFILISACIQEWSIIPVSGFTQKRTGSL